MSPMWHAFRQALAYGSLLQVNWTAVAPEAELRLAVQLHAVWNAAVDNSTASNATALHIFGVRPGQCPPGTYR